MLIKKRWFMLSTFDAKHTIKKFNKSLGTFKIITYDILFNLKNTSFGNTIVEPDVISTLANNLSGL